MNFMKSLCSLVNFKVSWGTRRLKVCMHKIIIIIGGMIATTGMKITMRGMVAMMKAKDSIQNLTFRNLMEELMLMNSWIGLIWWIMSLSIMTPPEHEKVKLVAIKMCKNASIWWKNMKRQREKNDKKKIETWEKMKKELKMRYLPTNYHQDIYLEFQNFKQQDFECGEVFG